MVTLVLHWDNQFGFSCHKIQMIAKHYPFMNMYDSMSYSCSIYDNSTHGRFYFRRPSVIKCDYHLFLN